MTTTPVCTSLRSPSQAHCPPPSTGSGQWTARRCWTCRRWRCPTLYVWSTGDKAIGRTAAEATAEWVEGPYRFEVLEHVSHWIPEMAPDELSALLLQHLAANESPAVH